MAKLKLTIKLPHPLPYYRMLEIGKVALTNASIPREDNLSILKFAEFQYFSLDSSDVQLVEAYSPALMENVYVCPGNDFPDRELERLRFKSHIPEATAYFLITPQADSKLAYTGKDLWIESGEVEVSRYGRVLHWAHRARKFAIVREAGGVQDLLILVEDLPAAAAENIIRFG